ncbi:hypothetical protein F2Q68_00006846 [Brassica cretica]|uniref:Uncharacterized protein n=1 Tax=Brassica cretica TaxID=69181 RepID=A0A8S9JH69_BRACR|nr:hypothetical protein F2Q68_00006846 [Brassica cretica]KAF3515106.1 hypothetical protein F2Q69_00010044 [Brassica cretica]
MCSVPNHRSVVSAVLTLKPSRCRLLRPWSWLRLRLYLLLSILSLLQQPPRQPQPPPICVSTRVNLYEPQPMTQSFVFSRQQIHLAN